MVPDAELRERMKAHLSSKPPLFGAGSVFSELLQPAVNAILNGEMEDFMAEERAREKPNKRNGYTRKQGHSVEDMRRLIYTTNPLEALHRIVRKLIKGKAAWVSDTALLKQLYLSLMYNEKSWKRQAFGWKTIQRNLIDLYGQRIMQHLQGS